jgi:hypothetical protein
MPIYMQKALQSGVQCKTCFIASDDLPTALREFGEQRGCCRHNLGDDKGP